MAGQWSILLVLIGGALSAEAKNLADPKKVLEIPQYDNNNKFHYNQSATTMRERPHKNLIVRILEDADVDVDTDKINLTPGADCARICYDHEPPFICKFEFTLEHYHTMGP